MRGMKKYNVLGVIGTGAQATAYLVEHKEQKRRYVMKKVVPACRQMIEQEVQILLQLKHPNIITYHECFEHDMCLHIVTEYCQGGDLDHLLAAIKKKGQIVSPEVGKQWVAQLSSALQYCHEHNIIHRDVKTANVFLSEDQRTVMLGDFGIARILDGANMANTLIGSPYNFSPELVQGRGYDAKSDMWALGCVMYEVVTLKRPFDVDNISQLVQLIAIAKYGPMDSTVPVAIKNIVALLLQKDPKGRPSAKEVATLLGANGSGRRRSSSNAEVPPPPPPPQNALPVPPPSNQQPARRSSPLESVRRRSGRDDHVDLGSWAAQRYKDIDSIMVYIRLHKPEDDVIREEALRRGGAEVHPKVDLKAARAKVPQVMNNVVKGKMGAQMAAADEKREKLSAERDAKAMRREEEKARMYEDRQRNAEGRLKAAESRRLLVPAHLVPDPRSPSTPPEIFTPSSDDGGGAFRRSQTAQPVGQQDRLDNSLRQRQHREQLREQLTLDRAKAKESPTKPFEVEVFCKERGGRVRRATPPPEPRPALEPLPAVPTRGPGPRGPSPTAEGVQEKPTLQPMPRVVPRAVNPPPIPVVNRPPQSPIDIPKDDKRSALQAMMAQQRKARVGTNNDFDVEIVIPQNLRKLPQNQM